MTDNNGVGRRERKKAATRKAISDAATVLFLERGFDDVSIREIADRADVSPTTVFAHFPQKEALVFDEDDAIRDELVAVIHDRPKGQSVVQAFREHLRHDVTVTHEEHGDGYRQFMALIEATPALNDYAQRMWLRHEDAIAAEIAADAGLAQPNDEIRVFARFALQVSLLAASSDRPLAMIDTGFDVLEHGWAAVQARWTTPE